MKKSILSFSIIFTFLFASFVVNEAYGISWNELSQNERNLYIQKNINDINSTAPIDISEKALENTFKLNNTRDPNYKEHRKGKLSIEGVKIQQESWNYLIPGPHQFGKRGVSMPINSGYSLTSDNITLHFNKSGNLTKITTYQKISSDNLLKKEYNKYKQLQNGILYTKDYQIYFDSKMNIEKIQDNNKLYKINGKQLN